MDSLWFVSPDLTATLKVSEIFLTSCGNFLYLLEEGRKNMVGQYRNFCNGIPHTLTH